LANQTNGASQETAAKDEASLFAYDTENCWNIIAAWGVYDQNAIKILRHRQIITVSWVWLGKVPKGEKKRGTASLPDFPMYDKDPNNNIELIKFILAKMEKAHYVAGHNARKFDNKRVNTDIIKHGLTPPPPHKVVDSLAILRKYFGFNQNSLKAICGFLGLPLKIETGGSQLWADCDLLDRSAKCMQAWAKMGRYCAGDMVSWMALYLRIRPWDQGHPPMRVREDTNRNPRCPACSERRLINRGFNISRKGKSPRFQCRACGHWPPVAWIQKAWRVK
jgi:hypothetical protein